MQQRNDDAWASRNYLPSYSGRTRERKESCSQAQQPDLKQDVAQSGLAAGQDKGVQHVRCEDWKAHLQAQELSESWITHIDSHYCLTVTTPRRGTACSARRMVDRKRETSWNGSRPMKILHINIHYTAKPSTRNGKHETTARKDGGPWRILILR